jgi:molybdopterin adenylyltransferase
VVVTVGGAGCSARDMTPDATESVIEKDVPGIADAIRLKTQNPKFLLSRGVSGIRKETLILNLPGNPESARIAIDLVIEAIPHCIKTIQTQKPRKKRTASTGFVGQESPANRSPRARKLS